MKSCLVAWVGVMLLCSAPSDVPIKGRENVAELLAALKSRHTKDRYAAAIILGRMGPKAKAAVPALAEARKDAEAKVRRAAIESLVDIDPGSAEVLSNLVAALKDPQELVRHAAANALRDAGRQNRQVVPSVTKVALHDRDWRIRLLAVAILAELQPSSPDILPTLVEALKSQNEEFSKSAYWYLRSLDPKILEKLSPQAKAILPSLKELLKDDRPLVREGAVRTLGYLDPTAGAAIAALAGALKDKSKEVRREAANSLGLLGVAAPAAIPALIKALKQDNEVEVWFIAGSALAHIGPAAVPSLLEVLKKPSRKDNSILVWSVVARALGKIGPRAKEAIPLLEKALKDKHAFPRGFESDRLDFAEALRKIDPENRLPVSVAVEVLNDKELSQKKDFSGKRSFLARQTREQAIKILAALGPRAKEAIAALAEALKDNEWTTRDLAATALGKIGLQAQASVPALVAALQDDNYYVRIDAAEALAKVAPKQRRAALDALISVIKDETQDPHIHFRAAEALRKVDPSHQAVVPALVRVAKNTDHFHWQDRKEALKALEKMGPKAQAAVSDLEAIVEGQKGEQAEDLRFIRLDALESLNQIGLKKSAVPALVKALNDQGGFFGAVVRRESILALGRLGPAAKPAVPALTAALLDESKQVRTAAAKALKQIQGRK